VYKFQITKNKFQTTLQTKELEFDIHFIQKFKSNGLSLIVFSAVWNLFFVFWDFGYYSAPA
jgi:hypothetical protein